MPDDLLNDVDPADLDDELELDEFGMPIEPETDVLDESTDEEDLI